MVMLDFDSLLFDSSGCYIGISTSPNTGTRAIDRYLSLIEQLRKYIRASIKDMHGLVKDKVSWLTKQRFKPVVPYMCCCSFCFVLF